MAASIQGAETAMVNAIRAQLTKDFTEAAEPIIQQAVVDFEKEMRKKLANRVLALVDSSYSLERMGKTLTIRVEMRE